MIRITNNSFQSNTFLQLPVFPYKQMGSNLQSYLQTKKMIRTEGSTLF